MKITDYGQDKLQNKFNQQMGVKYRNGKPIVEPTLRNFLINYATNPSKLGEYLRKRGL